MQSHPTKININQSLIQQAVLLSKDDHRKFNALCTSFQSDIQPRDAVERAMVGLIVLASWNLRRADRAEAQLAVSTKQDPLLSDSKILERIAIFRLRAERTLFKSLKELRAIRKEDPRVKPQFRYELKYINPKPTPPKTAICKTNPIAAKSDSKEPPLKVTTGIDTHSLARISVLPNMNEPAAGSGPLQSVSSLS